MTEFSEGGIVPVGEHGEEVRTILQPGEHVIPIKRLPIEPKDPDG